MSSSAVKNPPNKASNPSVPLATSAWSKGPPQSSATSRAQSPANAPSTPTTQSRRQSTLGQGANATVKQASRGVATGTGHRQASSINFGSIEANQAPEKKAEVATPPPTAPTPATAPAATSKPAPAPVSPATPTATQPSTNGIKVVAPTPTQPMPTSTAPATTTASTGASTAPAAAPTPPGTTPTPSKQKKLNVHALFQGGGPPSVTATPAAPSSIPSTNAPANQPPTAVPSAPRGPAPGFSDRNNPAPFPRSPQIGRPPLPGPNTSGGQRPPASPRMNNMPIQQHHQHPMAHPHQHHSPHPGHPMPPAPQWGPTGYYYPPPHDYNPYMYWGGHPPHQHQHHMPPIHQPPMQPSPRTQPAQPRPPSTPPATNNATPHTLPPITTSALQALPSAPSPSLSVNAPTFVPGGLRRPTNPVRISTPGGDALTFEGVPLSPKVSTPIQPKRPNVVVRMETEQQKNERLAREKEEKERLAKEKEEKERKERERIEEEKRAKEEAERKEKEEAERKAKEEADRKAEAERKVKEEAERKAEEERKAKEEEEKRIAEELRAKEEAERKVKEEEARKAREEEERKEAERKAKEEAERKAKEEEERKAKEEMERKLKEEEERKAKEEAEAKAKEEKAKAEAEAKAKAEVDAAKEEAEAKEAATEEARDTVPASPISSPKPPNGLLPSTIPDRPSPLSNSTTAPGRPSPLSITTSQANERPKRPVPGPLDLTSAQGNRSAAPPSALASARIIEDLNVVPYPETIKTPNPDLNIAATPGKFRYDREFLLQFMNVCKEKPDSLPPLDAIGLEPGEQGAGYPGGARAGGRRVGSMGMGNAPPLQRQGSVGLGLGPGLAKGGFAMGNFQSPSSSQARFDASNAARSGMAFGSGAAGRLTPMSRSASQGGVGGAGPREAKRTRSQRGQHRGDNPRASGFQTPANQPANLEPVVPLEQSENRWVAGSTLRTPQQLEERQLVDRKVKALLNKLTMDKFDSISDQIIEWANKSEQEKDGSTLMQVIKLVFEKAKDEAAFSEMYARLCRKMMERVSPNVQDETIRNSEGQPITGGMLFRKYLLNRCQEDFERGWNAKEAALAAAASKAGEDKAAEAASTENGEAVLYSDEYYAAAKAKRQGLGLVRFIGELFKLQMLTERIMHECIKKLLSNVVNPEEEEIESLCKLLTTVGQSLDNPKARNHMDIYFERMQEMAKGSSINSRMQFMLQDVIELRARHWQARSAAPRPPPTHQDSSRDDSGRHGVSRGGSRRGEHRGANATEPDGWNVAGGAGASRPPARAGDLSQFGKISKPTGIQFGPSSVFSKKDANKRDSSIGRASGANMFSALSGGTVDGPPPPAERTANSRKPSVDLGPGGSPVVAGAGERKKLNLLPRTKPTEADNDKGDGKEEDKEEDKEEAPVALTEEEIQSKVKEDVKEYLGVENIDEAILALEALPSEHRHLFVDKLVNASMDGGNKVVVLTEKLFSAARSRSVISPEGFERGMIPTIEMADDLSIDVPKTYEWLARMIHAAGLDRARAEEMANNISVYGEPPVPPRELLLKEFEKVSSA
ncbi:ARM repeat-containing protein [Rhizoctonia solani]|uniref:ARM repeat-containing protein n=1 Tax=Rhizoctonia solani TaxID=456999 RepID=A0A8H7LIT0_9AGAM|nr:ARM repeat-containing protein [Rhizoctonia solani]